MGAMDATAASRLPPLLPRFRALCPEVTLTLKTQPTRQLTQQVLDAALDCALVSLPQGTPPPDDLEYVSIFKEQLLLVLPASPQRFRFAAFAPGLYLPGDGGSVSGAIRGGGERDPGRRLLSRDARLRRHRRLCRVSCRRACSIP